MRAVAVLLEGLAMELHSDVETAMEEVPGSEGENAVVAGSGGEGVVVAAGRGTGPAGERVREVAVLE